MCCRGTAAGGVTPLLDVLPARAVFGGPLFAGWPRLRGLLDRRSRGGLRPRHRVATGAGVEGLGGPDGTGKRTGGGDGARGSGSPAGGGTGSVRSMASSGTTGEGSGAGAGSGGAGNGGTGSRGVRA